jgi:hypothetical protein
MTDYQKAAEKLAEHYGSREGMLLKQVIHFSTFQQPCDVTFYARRPMLDVTVSPKYGAALMYGAGAAKMQEMFATIEFTDGDSARLEDIWTFNPMPKGGLSAEDLAAADLSDGDAVAGPNGETVREMIRQTYHCQTDTETDEALRRFLAS